MDTKLIDEIVTVSNDDAIGTARKLASAEGIPCGFQAGRSPRRSDRAAAGDAGKMIVTVIPDFAERYISTVLFEGLGT